MGHVFPLGVGDDRLTWVVYALGGVSILYLVVIRPMFSRRKRDPLAEIPKFGVSQQRAVERQMNDLLVELSEMARQITAQLDTRARKLEMLIDEADRRIAQLGGAGAASPGRASPSRSTEQAAPDALSQHADIYALADQGRSAHEIATALDRPRGEIELILALRPRGIPAGDGGDAPVQNQA